MVTPATDFRRACMSPEVAIPFDPESSSVPGSCLWVCAASRTCPDFTCKESKFSLQNRKPITSIYRDPVFSPIQKLTFFRSSEPKSFHQNDTVGFQEAVGVRELSGLQFAPFLLGASALRPEAKILSTDSTF